MKQEERLDRLVEGASELLVVGKRLAESDKELGAGMLLLAAAALVWDRDEFVRKADLVYDLVGKYLKPGKGQAAHNGEGPVVGRKRT